MEIEQSIRNFYKVQDQILHAYELKFQKVEGAMDYLSDRQFQAEIPPLLEKVLQGEDLSLRSYS